MYDIAAINFGADPEFAVVNTATGEAVPAHNFFPDKDHKLYPLRYSTGAALFRDGYMVEINMSPYTCRTHILEEASVLFQEVRRRLPVGHRLLAVSAIPVKRADLVAAPADVREFGCEPSLDAYTERKKYVNLDGVNHEWRYAGGHLHFSDTYGKNGLAHPEQHAHIIKRLDRFLGLPLSYIFDSPEQYMRRRYYGQAGEFRTQHYGEKQIGLEYRTPGPEMWNHWAFVSFAMGVARRVIQQAQMFPLDIFPDDDVRGAINEGIALERMVAALPPMVNFYNFAVLGALRDLYRRDYARNLVEYPRGYGNLSASFTEFANADWKLRPLYHGLAIGAL